MRDGIAFGFIRMFGRTSVNRMPVTRPRSSRTCIGSTPHGMSSRGSLSPITPFCPWRALNLSPTIGTAGRATCTFRRRRSRDSASTTLTTVPGASPSPASVLWSRFRPLGTLTVLPITAAPPTTIVPGSAKPCSPSRE